MPRIQDCRGTLHTTSHKQTSDFCHEKQFNFHSGERASRDSVAVVPSFQLYLIRFLLGSKRWGDACAYQGPPLDQP